MGAAADSPINERNEFFYKGIDSIKGFDNDELQDYIEQIFNEEKYRCIFVPQTCKFLFIFLK